MSRLLRALVPALLLTLLAGPALAAPVVVAVASFLTAGFTQGVLVTIGTFLLESAITTAVSWGANKLFGPKAPKGGAAGAQDRQASVTALTVGEVAREMILGEAATGGSLAAVFNHGGTYGTDWVVRVIVLADHRCHSLAGVYVNDTFVAYAGDGAVSGYNGQFELYFRDGQAGQLFPAALLTAWQASPLHAAHAPATTDILTGLTYVVAATKADAPDAATPVWSGGLPQLLFRVKGKFCYDPRKDSTAGGAGLHRWADGSTWEWTRNAAICRYNWVRGVYALDQTGDPGQLLIGRGLSAYEAPPANVFAYANLCDELVDNGAGGTEPRYFTDGVIRSTDTYLSVEQLFEAATAGQIIQPRGGIEVEPGQAKTPVYSITDDDLVVGAPLEFNAFASDVDRVNTVIPRYIEPSQKWSDFAAPVQRDLTAVALDGPREFTLSLSLVTRATQAQRVGQITLRQKMLERTAKIILPPRFAEAEEGDWIQWTSARHTGGAPVVFRITSYGSDQSWRAAWSLEETGLSVYGFTGSPLPASGGQTPTIPPGALALAGVTALAIQKEGSTSALIPAIRVGWTTPVDRGVQRIRVEVRENGHTQVAPTTTEAVGDGVMDVTNGVGPNMALQVRLVPLGAPGRPIAPSSWINVTTGDLVGSALATIGGMSVADFAAAAAATAAQGDALTQAVLQLAMRTIEARQAMVSETFHNGQRIRRLLVDDGEDFTDGAYSVTHRLQLLGLVTDAGGAFTLSDTTLKVSPTQTWADYKTAVAANFASVSAAVSSEATARASADSAFASSLSSVSTTLAGHTASITTLQTSINGLSAEYKLVVAAGTGVASIQAYAGGGLSSLVFSASAIGFWDGTTSYFPFSIAGGVVKATNLEVDTFKANSITIGGIAVGATSAAAIAEASSGAAVHIGSETSCSSVSFTASGAGKIRIDVRVRINNPNTTTDAGYLVTLYKDGSAFTSMTMKLPKGDFTNEGCFFALDSAASAGSHTYQAKVQATLGSADPTTLVYDAVIVTELRKAG